MTKRHFVHFQSAWTWLRHIWARCNDTNASLLAAAVAFYTMLSIFPALTALISVYGLIAAPEQVERQLALAQGVLPAEALTLISDQIANLLDKKDASLGIGLLVGVVVTLWSARSAALAVMSALNAIYRKVEERSIVRQQLVALGLTLGGIATGVITLVALAIVPVIVAFLPFQRETEALLTQIRWPAMTGVVLATFSLIYRFAPCHHRGSWSRIVIGASVAAIFWLLGSSGFSFYVSSIGSYDRIYGSLGAVVILLIWFYVSALTLLIGAAIDAELEQHMAEAGKLEREPALDSLQPRARPGLET